MAFLPSWSAFFGVLLLVTLAGASVLGRLRAKVVTRPLALTLLAMGVAATVWSTSVGLASNPIVYHAWLVELPVAAQGILGLPLVLGASWLTALLFAETFPALRTRLALVVFTLLLAVGHAALPIHLSAPDFDDFFTVDKFLGSTSPQWMNTKPDLCVYDFLYRIGDAFVQGVATDTLERFRINAWFFGLYLANLLIVLKNALQTLPVQQLGRRPAWLATALALSWLGPVVLSHTLAYELAGATFFLIAFNALESIRRQGAAANAAHVLAILGAGLVLQALSFNAASVCWGVVYVHGLLVLRDLAAPRLEKLAAAIALLAGAWLVPLAGAWLVLDRDGHVDPHDLGDKVELMRDYARIVLPVALVGLLTWQSQGGKADFAALWRSLRTHGTRATAIALYFLGTLAIYVHGNQGKFGIFFPNRRRGWHWDYATNHARYGVFFFPFLCVAWAYALLRYPRLSPRVRLLALVATWAAWNTPYIAEFYADSGEVTGQHAPYRANDRTMRQLDDLLKTRAADERFGYLPIPRDHADHYLLRAVRPTAPFADICQEHNDLTVVLSWHTLDVLRDLGVKGPIWRPGVAQPDLRREVWLVQRDQFAPQWLHAWCGHFDRREWICF